MKKYYITLFFFFFSVSILFAQQPNLLLEGQASIDTTFDDGFEDANIAPFSTGGGTSWSVQSAVVYTGMYSAQSGIIPDGYTSYLVLVLTLSEPSSITFAAKVSSQLNFDFLRFYLDGVEQLAISGERDWEVYSFELPSGASTLRWSYTKDLSISHGSDAAWIDNVRVQHMQGQVLQITDGLEGNGQVLVSNYEGKATWANPKTLFKENSLPLILDKDMPYGAYGPEDGAPLIVENNLGVGIRVRQAYDGMRVYSSERFGFIARNSGDDGFYSIFSSDDGFIANLSGDDGFYSLNAGDDGFFSNAANDEGFFSWNAGNDGFLSAGSFDDGFYSLNAGDDGFYSDAANDEGFYSLNAGNDGFLSAGSIDDGFYSLNAGDDGFYSLNATSFGFYSNEAGGNGFVSGDAGYDGFVSFYSNHDGFRATGSNNHGIYSHDNAGDGIYCVSSGGDAGYFSGAVVVTGNLTKGGGSFKIDHPLDPENKFLYHSFVESPDMMNVYNGNIVTDENGEATVTMQDWFETLNRDFRYQLTSIGAPGPNLYIAEEILHLSFKIGGGAPNAKVSWQITGIRQDPYANQNRIEVEVDKPAEFKGQYIHPEAYEQPFEKGFDYVKLGHKTLEELDAEHAAESMERKEDRQQEKIKREAAHRLELLHDQQKEMVDKKEN